QRQPRSHVPPDIKPVIVNATMLTGQVNATPNPNTKRIKKLKYPWASMKLTPSAGVNLVKKYTARGKPTQAIVPPITHNGIATAQKATASHFSLRESAGVINAQNWYSHQGRAKMTPRKIDTLIRMSNDVATPEKFRAAVRPSPVNDETGSA